MVKLFINPKITPVGPETAMSTKTCFSLPNKSRKVRRFKKIRIEYFTVRGQRTSEVLKGQDAIVAQHELDHLDGILITDPR